MKKTRILALMLTAMFVGSTHAETVTFEEISNVGKPLDAREVLEVLAETPKFEVAMETTKPGIAIGTPELDLSANTPSVVNMESPSAAPKLFRLTERPDVKAPKFLDDMTWVGIPIFIAGAIAKSEKNAFRQNYDDPHAHTRLVTNFKTGIDDYTQYFGPAMTLGLKIGGVEGRSDWPRMLASAAMGYAGMAIMVNAIKYTAKEMRPDGTSRNSWPSGHTATSFVGATLLHKEYGLTRSPWYSVAGYGVATATGVMRVLNNRHWVSDVLSGAGIGIFCGELGYALSDVFFKGRGLLRGNLPSNPSKEDHPSFFSISMGVGLGNNDLNFGVEDYDNDPLNLKFGASTVVGAEGAYFLNKYIGLGGRLSVKSSPIKGWNNFLNTSKMGARDYTEALKELDNMFFPGQKMLENTISNYEMSIESDHMTEFTGSVGLYFNLPLSNRFSLGTKALIGRSVMQALDIDATASGKVVDMQYAMYLNNSLDKVKYYVQDKEVDFLFLDPIPGAAPYNASQLVADGYNFINLSNIRMAKDEKGNDLTYDTTWDYLTVDGSNSTSWGTGLSLSYRYKDSFTWKVFCDVDFTKKNYTLTYNPYNHLEHAIPDLKELYDLMQEPLSEKVTIKKNMTSWVIGGSFSINF